MLMSLNNDNRSLVDVLKHKKECSGTIGGREPLDGRICDRTEEMWSVLFRNRIKADSAPSIFLE